MAQREKAVATEPNDQRKISRTHMGEGRAKFCKLSSDPGNML